LQRSERRLTKVNWQKAAIERNFPLLPETYVTLFSPALFSGKELFPLPLSPVTKRKFPLVPLVIGVWVSKANINLNKGKFF
jgi:hypothetical protein